MRVLAILAKNPVELPYIACRFPQPIVPAQTILQRVLDLIEQGGHVGVVLNRDRNRAEFAGRGVDLNGLCHRQFSGEHLCFDPVDSGGDGFRALLPDRIVNQSHPPLKFPVEWFAVEKALIPFMPIRTYKLRISQSF